MTDPPAARSSRVRRVIHWTALLSLAAMVTVAAPARAATNIGKNIGNELEGFARPVLLVLAAIFMFPLLKQGKHGALIAVAGAAFVIGAFIFAPGAIEDMIVGVTRSVSKAVR